MDLRDLIMVSRKRSKMSQGELADQLGTNRATVSYWETGGRVPSLVMFAGLRSTFGWGDELTLGLLDSMGEKNEST